MAAPMGRGKFRRRRSENLEKPKFLAIQFHFFCVSCFEVSFTLLNWLIGPWGVFPLPCLSPLFVARLLWSVACNMREAKPQQIKSVSPLARKCLLQIHSFICIAEFGLNVIWYTADNGRGPQLWSMEHWQSRGDPAPNGTHSTRGNRSLIWLRRMANGEWRMQMGFVTNDMQFSNTSDAQTHTRTLVQRMQLKGTPRRNLHSSWKRFKKWSVHKKGERRIRRTYKAGAKTFSRRSQWPSPLLLLLFATLPLFRVCPKQGTAHPKSGKKARLPAWPMWLQFLDYGVAWIFLSVPKPRHKQSGRSPSAINPVEIQHTHTHRHTAAK